MAEPLNTVKEASAQLRTHTNSVYALVQSEQLRAIRVGTRWLIPQSAIDEFIAGGGTGIAASALPR